MRRGTTPTITITTDIDLSNASNLFITFKQGNRLIFEKLLDDVTIDGTEITCNLTQEDTLALNADVPLRFQIRATLGESKLASNIMTASVNDILKGGTI